MQAGQITVKRHHLLSVLFLSPKHSSFAVRSDSSGDGTCDDAAADTIRSSILDDVRMEIESTVTSQLDALLDARYHGMISRYPAVSCAELLQLNPNTPSGYYWLRASGGGSARVWCNMELRCGPNVTGWARVAFLNLSDSRTSCPNNEGFRLVTSSRGVRYCERATAGFGCNEHIFPSSGISYDKVCGRVTGIQIGTADVFGGPTDIEQPYVDGVSLTYGTPRQHIWTFIGYYSARFPECPCSTGSTRTTLDFVGQDYFCESGTNENGFAGTRVFDEDPLWDGLMCTDTEVPCCNGPPWFYKSLTNPASDDISFRLCSDQGNTDEEMAFTLVEIYVQ